MLCRYRWLGIAPRNMDWWGAFSYTVGVGMYWVAALSTIINDCPNTLLDPIVYVSCLTRLPHAPLPSFVYLNPWRGAAA